MPSTTNTQFALAVHVLTLMGRQPQALTSSDTLATSTGASAEHVRRVLAPLRRGGLVRSRSGPSGGWQLDQADSDTTLAEIWRVVHGDDPVLGIHQASRDCPTGRRIQAALEDLERHTATVLLDELEQQTLGGLMAKAGSAPIPA